MPKEYDMNIALEVCRSLADLVIANPNQDAPTASVGAHEPRAQLAKKLTNSDDPQKALHMAMAASLGAAMMAKVKVGKRFASNSKEYIVEQGKEIIKTKKARCDQCSAAVTYKLLQERWFSSSIELLGNNHHCWLLCGRSDAGNKDSINNIDSWGSQAFIVDLWVGLQYQNVDSSVDANPMVNEYSRDYAELKQLFVIQTFDEFDLATQHATYWS